MATSVTMSDEYATYLREPEAITMSISKEPTQDFSADVGSGCDQGDAAPKQYNNVSRKKQVKSKRAMFYSNRRKKSASATGIAIVPNSLDILRGRGGKTNRWAGNLRFRDEARKLKGIYREEGTTHDDKFLLTWELVNRVDDYGGR